MVERQVRCQMSQTTGKEVWFSKKNTTKLKEGRRREKRDRDNEGGIESGEISTGVNLSQSDQCVTNSLQDHSVDTQAALRDSKVRMFFQC